MIGYLTVEPNRRYHLFIAATLVIALAMAALIFIPRKNRGAIKND